MKFYTAEASNGVTLTACKTLREAKTAVREAGGGEVWMVDVDVNAETVRLLLASNGGYAKETRLVWQS